MIELEALASGPLAWFRDWPNPDAPLIAAGVYTVWDGKHFVYAGMAGKGLSADRITALRANLGGKPKGLRERLASHAAGRRSGDQFCVYVADRLVLPMLRPNEIRAIGAGELRFDALVRKYIHEHLAYRWIEVRDAAEAFRVEAEICGGAWASGLPS